MDAIANIKVLETKNRQVNAQQLVINKAFNATLVILLVIDLWNKEILLIDRAEIFIFSFLNLDIFYKLYFLSQQD